MIELFEMPICEEGVLGDYRSSLDRILDSFVNLSFSDRLWFLVNWGVLNCIWLIFISSFTGGGLSLLYLIGALVIGFVVFSSVCWILGIVLLITFWAWG